MKDFIRKLGEKNFLVVAILLSLLGDLFLCFYIREKFQNFEKFKELYFQVLTQMQVNPNELPPNFVNEQYYLVTQAILLMIFLIIAVQLLHYALYYAKKNYGKKYFYSMNIMALICAPLIAVTEFSPFTKWAPLFLIQTIFYIFTVKGHAHYFKNVAPQTDKK